MDSTPNVDKRFIISPKVIVDVTVNVPVAVSLPGTYTSIVFCSSLKESQFETKSFIKLSVVATSWLVYVTADDEYIIAPIVVVVTCKSYTSIPNAFIIAPVAYSLFLGLNDMIPSFKDASMPF